MEPTFADYVGHAVDITFRRKRAIERSKRNWSLSKVTDTEYIGDLGNCDTVDLKRTEEGWELSAPSIKYHWVFESFAEARSTAKGMILQCRNGTEEEAQN